MTSYQDELPPFHDAEAASAEGPPGDLNPWLSVWVRPRATYRYVWDRWSHTSIVLLSMAGGVFGALDNASSNSRGDGVSMPILLVGCLIGGLISGFIFLYLSSWLGAVTGRWLGGTGDSRRLRYSYGLGSAMAIMIGVLWVPYLALFGREMFTEEMPRLEASPALASTLIAIAVVEVILTIWMLVCWLKLIGEAHEFSAWRALGSTLLAGVLLVVPLLLVAVVAVVLVRAM